MITILLTFSDCTCSKQCVNLGFKPSYIKMVGKLFQTKKDVSPTIHQMKILEHPLVENHFVSYRGIYTTSH